MTTHDENQSPQRTPFDTSAVAVHLAALASTRPCPRCEAVAAVIDDAWLLLHAVAELRDELAAARLDAANLRAAMQAALGASADGEPDSLAYLRWELADHTGRSGR